MEHLAQDLSDAGVRSTFEVFADRIVPWVGNVALILLRYREPDTKRPFRVAWTIGRFPVLPALGGLMTLAIATQLEPVALLGGLGTTAVLGAFAAFWQWRKA